MGPVPFKGARCAAKFAATFLGPKDSGSEARNFPRHATCTTIKQTGAEQTEVLNSLVSCEKMPCQFAANCASIFYMLFKSHTRTRTYIYIYCKDSRRCFCSCCCARLLHCWDLAQGLMLGWMLAHVHDRHAGSCCHCTRPLTLIEVVGAL